MKIRKMFTALLSSALAFACLAALTVRSTEGHALTRQRDDDAPPVCSLASLHGTYGFQRNGGTPKGALTAIGTATFDGQGNGSFQQTIGRNGTFSTATAVFTYTVNSDCTSTAIDNTGFVFAQQVVVHNGGEVLGMSMTPGNNVAIHFERIFDPPSPSPEEEGRKRR